MLPTIEYLEFAGRYFGRSEHDLATSGVAMLGSEELGADLPLADFSARERFAAAVAARYGRPGAEVVPCLGTSGALHTACAGLLAPGDGVLVEAPAYEPLWRIPEGLGARVTRFERLRDDAYAVDPRRVLAALDAGTRLVIVTNPHNPTAALTPEATLRELASELSSRGVRLLVDEAYLELFAPGTTARGLEAGVLTCSSATKCWAVPWARAGWLLAPAELARGLGLVERHTIGLAPPLCWAAGERAVLRADALLARAHQLQRGKRAAIDAFMARMAPAYRWQAPGPSAVFGWIEATNRLPLTERLDRARRDHGVLVAPGVFFGDAGAFRMSWVSAAEKLDAALASLERALCVDSPSPS